MKKQINVIARLFVAVAISANLTACDNKEAKAPEGKPTIKIGVNLPLTGNLAEAGLKMSKSLEMAMNDAKKKNLKYNYELVIEDNVFENKKTVMNLNKFVSYDKVNALMTLWGTAGILTGEVAEKNKLVHMSCSLSNVVGNGYYNFNHATTMDTHVNKVVSYYKEKGYKRIGLFYDSVLEVIETIDALKPAFEKAGMEVVFDFEINPGEKDITLLVQKMKAAKPDVIFAQIVDPALTIFAKRRLEQKLDAPITNINIMSFAPQSYEGQVYFTEDEGKSEFGKRYEAETSLTLMPCVVNFYDGFNMIVDGYELTGDGKTIPNNEDVVKTMLNNKNFKSVLDKISMDKEGNIDSPSIIKIIKNGKPVKLEK